MWVIVWAEVAVINASPLIFLSRGRCLHLLLLVADVILVPEPVVVEIRAKGGVDPTAQGLASTPWLREALGVPAPPLIASWGFGRRGVCCVSAGSGASWNGSNH